jgi:hypothetical protein
MLHGGQGQVLWFAKLVFPFLLRLSIFVVKLSPLILFVSPFPAFPLCACSFMWISVCAVMKHYALSGMMVNWHVGIASIGAIS